MSQRSDSTPESDLPNIGRPARAALHAAGYYTLEQLAHLTEKQVLGLHGVGPKAIRILKAVMAEKGQAFRDG
ncbi:MAG: DNA-binding protein [bacterium]|nr:DNA-binding protein [bacterium]